MPRWMIIMAALLVAGLTAAKLSRHHDIAAAAAPADDAAAVRASVQAEIRQMKARLPIVLSPHVRITQVEFVNDVAVMVAMQDGVFEPSDDAKARFIKTVKEDYCHGSMKRAAEARLAIEVDLKTPSRTLDEPFGKTWVATFSPPQCR